MTCLDLDQRNGTQGHDDVACTRDVGCAGYHGTVAEFARQSLTLEDGALVGKSKGRNVADGLSSHGGLKPSDVPVVVDTVTRVLREVSDSTR